MYKRWEDEASFGDFITSHLLSSGSIRVQRRVLYELVRKRRMLSKQVFNNNLYRLEKKGVLCLDSEESLLVDKNRLRRYTLFSKIESLPAKDIKIMVLFDIPENKRKVRNWLRMQLKMWDFEMIQQSVWMGKGPLPKEFVDRLQAFGINKCVKILKVQKMKT